MLQYSRLRQQILNGTPGCRSLVEESLKKISGESVLNAFLSVHKDRALERADIVDQKIKQGRAGRLAGMILAVKDNLVMRHGATTCGSKILSGFNSPYDATVIRRLESEDAIIVGKTNMDEFGMGSSSENSAFGPVRNPVNRDLIPGGSSGGSAAAVAAGLVMNALGTDTGGSVRQPAALTGVVGLRPTYGRVSRYGLVAFASSLDQVGCLSPCVADSAMLLQVIAGKDEKDMTSADEPVPDYQAALGMDVKGLRIGLPGEYFGEGLEEDVAEAIENAVDIFRDGGAEIRSVSLPHTDYGIATYYLICTAEASSNLARFDGVRYGLRMGADGGLDSMYEQTRSLGFGDEVKRRIMLGTYVLSAGYYDAYYRKAQKVRTMIRRDYENAFRECDFIVGPTSPTTAFRIGEKVNDPMSMYLSDVYTVTGPLAGIPAISLPAGKDGSGLPIGLQITGSAFGEEKLLGTACWLETMLSSSIV